MEITEIKTKTKELALKIEKLVNEFQKETEFTVKDVSLRRIYTYEQTYPAKTEVTLRLEVEAFN